jgi:hypothetical protein
MPSSPTRAGATFKYSRFKKCCNWLVILFCRRLWRFQSWTAWSHHNARNCSTKDLTTSQNDGNLHADNFHQNLFWMLDMSQPMQFHAWILDIVIKCGCVSCRNRGCISWKRLRVYKFVRECCWWWWQQWCQIKYNVTTKTITNYWWNENAASRMHCQLRKVTRSVQKF